MELENFKPTKKTAVMIIGILVLGTIIITAILRDRLVYQNQYQISVVGTGKVQYKNDTAKINIGVQIDKVAKAEEALNQLNGKIAKIYQELEKLQINKEDIKTQNYSLNPNYDFINNISKVSGYNANQTMTITVKDIEKNEQLISKIISSTTLAGANQINGITFENSDISNIKQEARVKAIQDARSKSIGLEKALGVRLGKIVGWWENYVDQSYYAEGKGGVGGGNMTPTITSGNGEMTVEVNLSYKIK